MKRNKFTERQICNILKEGESGALIVPDLCRKISGALDDVPSTLRQ
jgi:hypothetical protein